MPEPEMDMPKPEPEDYYAALVQQRNQAMDLVVNLSAEVAMLRRQIDAFSAKEAMDKERPHHRSDRPA